MVSHEEMVRDLNDEFEVQLGDMKPYVLQLQLKSERQRCALWIKKLCEPHQHSGLEGRKLRNSYSKALLNMLKKGIMEGPLLHRPPDGKLQPLPSYLGEYLRDEEVVTPSENVPDWLADLDDQSSVVGGAGDFGHAKYPSPSRRSAETGHSAARHAAREKLEELLAHQTASATAGQQSTEEEELLGLGRQQRVNGHAPPQASGSRLRSPNKKRSALTVTFPAKSGYTSPLDEVTNRRVAAPASFQFSSDEEDSEANQRRRRDGFYQSDHASSSDRTSHRSPPRQSVGSPSRQPGRSHSPSRQLGRSHSPSRQLARSPVKAETRSPTRQSARSPRLSRYSRSPVYIREQARQLDRNFDREVEMKVKIIENQLHEEKLRMQQKNDAEIQKILDRKNAEIDEVKSQYKRKLEVSEEETSKLEKKVQTVLRDAQIVRENKDIQINELKKMAEETSIYKTNSLEKKFHDLQTEHEQEKIELQKAQTASIQQLMDDTSERLSKMEEDYRKQSKSMADTIRDLEKRIQVLTLDAEKVSSAKQHLEQVNIELEARADQLTADYTEYKLKYDQLDREHKKILEDHHHSKELLQEKHESQLNFARKEHQLTVTKDNDTILSLEQQVIQLKQNLQDAEALRQRQVREMEQSYQQDKQHTDNLHDKKIRSLHKEMEQQESDNKKRTKALEKLISEKEKDVERLQERLTAQASQAESSLQELRQQVEKQQEQVFSEMKQQMQQVEVELEKSKQARREQTDEFEKHVKEIAVAHERELKSISQSYEDSKSKLIGSHQQQTEHLVSAHKQELELLKKNSKAEKDQLEKSLKQRKSDFETKSSELSDQVHELKEELAQSENLRKQQLMELGLVKEEETQRMKHEHERAVERFKSECEREKHSLQKQHSADLEANIDKTNTRLKNLESDYSQRLTKQAEQVADLQLQLEQCQADKHQLTDKLESRIVDNSNRFEEEKKSLRKQSASTVMVLKQEVEMLKTKLRQSERNSENLLADHEEDLVQLRLEYEEKMRGLIPSDAREQLEATVNSLKNQVNTLKQRIAILQDS